MLTMVLDEQSAMADHNILFVLFVVVLLHYLWLDFDYGVTWITTFTSFRNNSLELMSRNIKYARTKTAEEIGIKVSAENQFTWHVPTTF